MSLLPVKIVRSARGYVLGQVYADLAPGIAMTLVECGRGEWVQPPVTATPLVYTPASVPAPATERPARGKRGPA